MTVLIVSRVQFLREMLQQAMRSAGIVARDGSDPDMLDAVPGIVIVDSSHPDGFAHIRALRARFPDVIVVVLAIGDSDEDFFAWASIGIAGYVEPETSTEELLAIIRRAGAGETVCPPRLTALLLSRFSQQSGAGSARASVHVLTGRERDVLLLLAEGLSNKLIARQLNLAEATVKNHVHSILEKWDLRSRGEAAACYRQSIAGTAFPPGGMAPARRLSLTPPGPKALAQRPQPAAALSMRSDRTSGTGL